MSHNPKTLSYTGIILGVLYGLSVRILGEMRVVEEYGAIVTISFMFIVPFVIGFIRVHFECKAVKELRYGKMIVLPWNPVFLFLLATAVTLLEGSICIAMALPAFMFCASLGGLAAGLTNRYLLKHKNSTLASVTILPFIMAPIEMNLPNLSKTYTVKNSIVIQAPPEAVWSQLANVKTINPSEFSFSLTALIGVPRPVEANMNGAGVGSVRTSRWEKGVEFKEIITTWVPNEKMTYSFDIDPEKIPDYALDKHVKLGGKYFSPLTGGYYISTDEKGNTILSLETTLADNTNFGIYSRMWGELIFRDFHMSLLKLMKSRAEMIEKPQ